MKNKVYNVLIIGAGKIGAFFDSPESKYVLTHAHAFTHHPGFKLIGFVDSDIKKAKKAAKLWKTKVFSNIDEAFDYCNTIDVICNATPDEIHYDILKKILDKKIKLVFTEKPLTRKLSEAREILKISKKRKIPILVNYRRRFVPEFIKLAEEIKAGIYGDFLTGTGYYGKGIMHNGSHLVDMLRFLVGEISSVKLIGKIFDYKQTDPSLSAVITLKNKKKFYLEYIDSRIYTIFEIDLLFSKGRLRIIDCGDKIEKQEIVSDKKFKSYKNISDSIVFKTSLNSSMYFAADNIYKYLINDEKLLNSIAEGLKTIESVNQILHS